MPNAILVPLDGSSLGEQALPVAQMIAQQHGAAIHLVHVHTPNDTIYVEGLPVIDADLHSLGAQHEQAYLDAAAQRLTAGEPLHVTTAVLQHPVTPALLRYAAQNSIDLIVFTSHGQSGLARAWLGNVADALVRHSHVPVLLLRPHAGEQPPPRSLKQVLLLTDGSAASEQVIPFAVALGKPFEATYTLLHVVNPSARARSALAVEPPADLGDTAEWEVQRIRAAERYLHTVAEGIRADGVPVDTRIMVHPQAANAILETAQDGIDLIALASHGHGGIRELLLGSVADKVLRGADVPVLMYRPREEDG